MSTSTQDVQYGYKALANPNKLNTWHSRDFHHIGLKMKGKMKRTQYCLTVCVTYQTMPTLNFLWNDKSHFLGLIAYVTSQKENRQLQLLGPSPNILLKHLCLNSSPRFIVHIYFLKCEDKQQGGLSCRRNELSYKSRWRKITVRNRAKFSDISSTGADGSAKPISSCPVKLYDLSSSAT